MISTTLTALEVDGLLSWIHHYHLKFATLPTKTLEPRPAIGHQTIPAGPVKNQTGKRLQKLVFYFVLP